MGVPPPWRRTHGRPADPGQRCLGRRRDRCRPARQAPRRTRHGLCGTRNLDLVASLGADQVIDETAQDFAQASDPYDVIFAAVGSATYRRCRPVLTPDGVYLTTAPSAAILLQTLWTAKLGRRTAKIMFAGLDRIPGKIHHLAGLAEAGRLRPILDRTLPLDDIVHAHHHIDQGHKTGTVAITI